MTRWLPHIHHGGSSGECTKDPEGGREGYYVDLCWFGFQIGITVGSLWAERRRSARFHKRYGAAA